MEPLVTMRESNLSWTYELIKWMLPFIDLAYALILTNYEDKNLKTNQLSIRTACASMILFDQTTFTFLEPGST